MPMPTDYATRDSLASFVSMQDHRNLIYREEEREMFPALKARFPSSHTSRSSRTDDPPTDVERRCDPVVRARPLSVQAKLDETNKYVPRARAFHRGLSPP